MKLLKIDRNVLGAYEGGFLVFHVEDSRVTRLSGPSREVMERMFDDIAVCRDLCCQLSDQANLKPGNAEALASYWKTPKTTVSALNLNLTDQCQLACVYCYARGGNYDRIKKEMDPATAITGLEKAMTRADRDREFRIEFFGGEPLLNGPTIERVLAWQQTSPSWVGHPHPPVNRISTNLSHFSEQALDVLVRGKMIVSISLDGTADIQNDQRPFKNGTGSFDQIMKNIQSLRSKAPDLTLVARMTVYKQDRELLRSIQELIATDYFDYVSVYPATVRDETNGRPGNSHFSPVFREQFLALAERYPAWVGTGRFKGCLELNRYCEALLTGKTVLNHCRAGAGYFTLSPDCTVHPCHRLVGDASMDLGMFEWNDSEIIERLRPWQTTVLDREGCRECHLRYLCGGGCKQENLAATGNLLGRSPRVCAYSHLLFEAAMMVIGRLHEKESEANGRSRRALRASFDELSRLFVLCGEPMAPNNRSPLKLIPPLRLGDYRFSIAPLEWL